MPLTRTASASTAPLGSSAALPLITTGTESTTEFMLLDALTLKSSDFKQTPLSPKRAAALLKFL